jgi:hypothetical protein
MLLALVSETGSKRRQSKPSRCVRHNQGFQQFNLLILIASLSSASSQNDARKIPGSELWEQDMSEIETTQKTMREACWGRSGDGYSGILQRACSYGKRFVNFDLWSGGLWAGGAGGKHDAGFAGRWEGKAGESAIRIRPFAGWGLGLRVHES